MTGRQDDPGISPERIRKLVAEVLSELTSAGAQPESRGGAGVPASRRSPTGTEQRAPSPRAAGGATRTKRPGALALAIGADHGGFALKESLKDYLEQELNVVVKDVGTHSPASVDYPDFALAVARAVASGECEKGIVVDTMGIGSSIAANKVRGVRAAVCREVAEAVNSRAHNDANVLALGSKMVNAGHARRLVREWLATPFEGGRHAKRVQKIVDAERG